MKDRSRAHWIWVPALLALLIVGLVPHLPDTRALGDVSPSTSMLPEATVAPRTATTGEQQALDERQAAYALEDLIIQRYEDASPAVVNITSRVYVTYRFMGTVPEEGTGSGFVYGREGHIVTNYHVVENAEELLVTLSTGQVYEAVVVGSDPTNDLAVLHIDAGEDLPEPLVLGDSANLRVGQFVIAIGNPFGLEQTLTTGVVSALGRVIESPADDRFIGEAIQTDAAINPGNSGGPLLDLQGRVIGVNSQIISPSGASSGIGFAVSAGTVRRVVPQLISRGYYAHPWLGLDMIPLSPSLSRVLREAGVGVPVDRGLLVLETELGSPAAKAGIQGASRWVRISRRSQLPAGGDVVTAIDGRPTADLQTLMIYLEMETAIGDTVELIIVRDGEELLVPVTLLEQPQR